MKSIDDTVRFVNSVVTFGTINGVINLDLGTFLTSPTEDGKGVKTETAISCRLRLDMECAKRIVAALQDQVDKIEAQLPPMPATPVQRSKAN